MVWCRLASVFSVVRSTRYNNMKIELNGTCEPFFFFASSFNSSITTMSSQEYSRKRRRPNLFQNDRTCLLFTSLEASSNDVSLLSILVRSLMYAFGDVPDPDPESIAALDDILQSYIIDIVSSPICSLSVI